MLILPNGEYEITVDDDYIEFRDGEGRVISFESNGEMTMDKWEEIVETFNNDCVDDPCAYDIVEAVHLAYEDEPEFEAKCLVYLKEYSSDIGIINEVYACLEEMGRCTKCGRLLKQKKYTELHHEFDPPVPETMIKEYCPYCEGE